MILKINLQYYWHSHYCQQASRASTGFPFNPLWYLYPTKRFQIRINDILRSRGFIFMNFHIPDIASLPTGLLSTPMKLSWCHACIYPLPVNLFSIPTGLQALPTALINNLFCFVFHRYIVERGDAENYDILNIFLFFLQTSTIFFRIVLH